MNFLVLNVGLGPMALRGIKLVTSDGYDDDTENNYIELWFTFPKDKHAHAIHWEKDIDYMNGWTVTALNEYIKEIL